MLGSVMQGLQPQCCTAGAPWVQHQHLSLCIFLLLLHFRIYTVTRYPTVYYIPLCHLLLHHLLNYLNYIPFYFATFQYIPFCSITFHLNTLHCVKLNYHELPLYSHYIFLIAFQKHLPLHPSLCNVLPGLWVSNCSASCTVQLQRGCPRALSLGAGSPPWRQRLERKR